MVQPIEIVEEPPMGQTQTQPMTKLQVGNALLAVNPGVMTPDRIKLGGSENQGATERQWQFENTNMVTKGRLAEEMILKTRTMMCEDQLFVPQPRNLPEMTLEPMRTSPHGFKARTRIADSKKKDCPDS
jgi:hypothetical protein